MRKIGMDNLRIDFLCTDGSPLKVTLKSVYGDDGRVGVGGAELALLTVGEELCKRGHEVHIYNNPASDGLPILHHPVHEFNPQEERDVLIIFRSPNPRGVIAKARKRIWWSCDQYTIGDFKSFAPLVDDIVCISPFHKEYFRTRYGITNVKVIDIPVRAQDYDNQEITRIPNRLIFASVPDRGLRLLLPAWNLIKQQIKDASLVITSDYRLWGVDERNQQHRVMWNGEKDVHFVGAIPRRQFVQEQLRADILSYPNTYDELFCIAVAEAQYAGAYPVTSSVGALQTTNMGCKIENSPNDRHFISIFSDKIIELLKNRDVLEVERARVMEKARERFHPDKIINTWEKLFK